MNLLFCVLTIMKFTESQWLINNFLRKEREINKIKKISLTFSFGMWWFDAKSIQYSSFCLIEPFKKRETKEISKDNTGNMLTKPTDVREADRS